MSSAADRYLVVVNHEEQYSIWPAARAVPAGWTPEGTPMTKQECLDRIDAVWTDMTPRSARPAPPSSGEEGAAR